MGRARQLKSTVQAQLYDPDNPALYSSQGITFKTLATGGKVLDADAMNKAKDENGTLLAVKSVERLLEGQKKVDPRWNVSNVDKELPMDAIPYNDIEDPCLNTPTEC